MPRDREIEILINVGGRQATLRTTRSQLERVASEQELARVISDAGLAPVATQAAKALLRRLRRRADRETAAHYLTLSGEGPERGEAPSEFEYPPVTPGFPTPRIGRLKSAAEIIAEEERYKGLAEAEVAILVFIVSNKLTEKGEDFEDTIRGYLQLLEDKYPKGKIEVAGVALGTKPLEEMSQEAVFSQLRAMRGKITGGVGESTGFWGYDQIHILGHGKPGDGLRFKGPKYFNEDLLEGGTAKDTLPLKPNGKVVIGACYASGGGLAGWLRATLDKAGDEYSRVHAVGGIFNVKEEETPPGSGDYVLKWHLLPCTKEIENFLDENPEE
jgi:hypothetical protein